VPDVSLVDTSGSLVATGPPFSPTSAFCFEAYEGVAYTRFPAPRLVFSLRLVYTHIFEHGPSIYHYGRWLLRGRDTTSSVSHLLDDPTSIYSAA
jgi:hypothetical protein